MGTLCTFEIVKLFLSFFPCVAGQSKCANENLQRVLESESCEEGGQDGRTPSEKRA